jgi:ADP-L-glycero-D-manno-heptose 6-epimerase
MNVLVTGASGLIGKNVLGKCEELEYKITTLEKDELNIPIEALISYNIDNLVKEAKYVFHVGAMADTSDFSSDVMYYNYQITKYIVDACVRYKTNLIFSSTQMIHGRDGMPENIYAWSKLACEDYMFSVKKPSNIRFVALRYYNVYGPGEEHKGKTASLAYQAWNNGTMDLWNASRDFVYVKDVVDANIYAMKQPDGVYEVGSGESRYAKDFVELMTKNGRDIEIIEKPKEDAPPWFQWKTESDISKYMQEWIPKYNLEDGTKDYLEYLA